MLMKHEGDYGFHLHHQQAIAIHGHRRTHWGTVIKLYPYIYISLSLSLQIHVSFFICPMYKYIYIKKDKMTTWNP